jgi:hypothetical protein
MARQSVKTKTWINIASNTQMFDIEIWIIIIYSLESTDVYRF